VSNPEHLNEIYKGVKSWNQWRRENPYIAPDLTKANLSSCDLSFADLRDVELCHARLNDAKLASANLTKANLSYTNLSKTCLRFANFTSTNLIQANLYKTDLRDTNFTNCNLTGSNLSETNLNGAYLRNAILHQANLSKAILNNANLLGADISFATLISAQLNLAIMKKVNLQNSDLTGVQARGSDLVGACLTGACIDWDINERTNLESIECDYVYLKKICGLGFTNRSPNNGIFLPGELTQRFKRIFETIEIVFSNEEIQEFEQSFHELQQEYPDEVLEVEVVEPKSDTEFVARFKTLPKDNYEDIEAFYKQQMLLAKASYELQAQNVALEIHKQRSADMMQLVKLALETKSINVSVEANAMSNSEKFTNNFQGANIANFANQINDNARQQSNQHNYGQEENLADVATEIKVIIDQISQSYPTNTVASEFIKRIDNNPPLAQRILSAFNAGSVSALEQFLNHPAASFVINALEDWQKTHR
jgi:Pentapeptide repeats (8 copies)